LNESGKPISELLTAQCERNMGNDRLVAVV
jgi:hypothetical protein